MVLSDSSTKTPTLKPAAKSRNDQKTAVRSSPRNSPATSRDSSPSNTSLSSKSQSLSSPILNSTNKSLIINTDDDSFLKPPSSEGSSSRKSKKKTCPCGGSTEGKDWVVNCSQCSQTWHSSCCNLKGTNSLSRVDTDKIVKYWQCPWCYTCAFPRPGTHPAAKSEKALTDKLLSCTAIQQINETVAETIKKALLPVSQVTRPTTLAFSEPDGHMAIEPMGYSGSNGTGHPGTKTLPPDRHIKLNCEEQPYIDYKKDYLPQLGLNNVRSFLDQSADKFVLENGHSVMQLGVPYSYTGSKAPKEENAIPPLFDGIISKVVTDFNLKHKPNSVLINQYPATHDAESESYLPFHADDEPSILADSEIVTITIGGARTLVFHEIHNLDGEEHTLTPENNSAYCMTRSSQAWYKHGIAKHNACDVGADERYSITLRCLNPKFRRSMLIIGDSNTKSIEFGAGKGKVGESYPGARIKAAHVHNIKPEDCIGYANIILASGTNDLRVEQIQHPSQIHQLADTLLHKLFQIRKLCPKAKITVMPVLPSKIPKMNRNIMQYNRLIEPMLARHFRDAIWYPNVLAFLDKKNLLSEDLTRNGDPIHLGDKGMAKYVRCVKFWVFEREKHEGRSNRSNGQPPGSRSRSPERAW